MRNIKLIIQYDGTGYHGWQRQPDAESVQEKLENALAAMTGESPCLLASGRTDAGVHAIGQVANFRTGTSIPLEGFVKGLNSILPWDISIRRAEEVPLEFHARKNALGKAYNYVMVISETRLPLWEKRAWVLPHSLDTHSVQQAAALLEGRHDFRGFQASGGSIKNTCRTVFRCRFKQVRSGFFPSDSARFYCLDIAADGFLRYMVRNIAGLLVEIGTGRKSPLEVSRVLESGDRSNAGRTAPPQGLYLKEVYYKTVIHHPAETGTQVRHTVQDSV